MTTDPGAVPPDANPLPEEEDLDWVVKGEQQQQLQQHHHHHGEYHHGEYQRSGSGQHPHLGQPQAQQEESSSLLADEDGMENIDIHSPNNHHDNLHHLQDTAATVATGVAIAAMAPVAVVGAGMAAMANSPTSFAGENVHHGHNVQQQQQQPMRGRRMCRRCKAFKPPRAHHCR